ncbi:MAG: VOC family protein [Novosphingobium sp.]|nr:VOC family protein [Novosphingobium sp.]
MIGYATVGSNDLDKAMAFYDEILAVMGLKPGFDHPRGGRMYVSDAGEFTFGVLAPFDGETATVGNGQMVALKADSTEQIRNVHAKALELGGADEGAPDWRGDPGGFYGAYFRDLDGNKLCAFRMGPE